MPLESPIYLRQQKVTKLNTLNNVARPEFLRLIVGLIFLIFFYISSLSSVSPLQRNDLFIPLLNFTNTAGPISFIFLIGNSIFRILRRSPSVILTAILLYLLSSIIYFGLGPLAYTLGNEATKNALNSNIVSSVTSVELLRTNLLNGVGTFFCALGIYVALGFYRFESLSSQMNNLNQKSRLGLPETAGFFFVVGFFIRFFLVLPYQFGMTSFVIPGTLANLGNLVDLGFAIIAYLSVVDKHGLWGKILFTLLPFHLLTTLLEFKKRSLMLALLLPVFGNYLANGKLKRLILSILMISLVYFWSQPFVHFGRDLIVADSGSIHRATLEQRYEIAKSYFNQEDFFKYSSHNQFKKNDSSQSGWMRLSFSGPQNFAMKEYDGGRPGGTLKNSWSIFIPRILWPEKPIGNPSKNFYRLVTGSDLEVSLLLGVYGDTYWSGGWGGVAALSSLMGIIFAFMSNFTMRVIQRRELIFLPVIMISLEMSLTGTTGFFVSSILGALPIYLFYILVTNFYLNFLSKKQQF